MPRSKRLSSSASWEDTAAETNGVEPVLADNARKTPQQRPTSNTRPYRRRRSTSKTTFIAGTLATRPRMSAGARRIGSASQRGLGPMRPEPHRANPRLRLGHRENLSPAQRLGEVEALTEVAVDHPQPL